MLRNKMLLFIMMALLAMPSYNAFASGDDDDDDKIKIEIEDDEIEIEFDDDDSDDDDSDDEDEIKIKTKDGEIEIEFDDDDNDSDDEDEIKIKTENGEIEIELEDGTIKIEIENEDGTKTELKFKNHREKMKFMSKREYTDEELAILLEIFEALKQDEDDISLVPVENIISNSFKFKFDTPPVIKSGRTLIPVRAVSESLGAQVSWDEETQTIGIVKDGMDIVINIGENIASVNGQDISLDVPPEIMKGRTVVPLRFIVENMGLKIKWDEDSRTIEIEDELHDFLDD